MLLLAALGMLAGTALPWAYILGRLVWASPLALTWTLWAGIVTLAAAAARWRALVLVSALAGGATAVVFAVWQTLRIVRICPLAVDCLPGPGLGFLLASGLAALLQASRLARSYGSSS